MRTVLLIIIMAVATHTAYPQQTARERIQQRQQSEAANGQSGTTQYQVQTQSQLNEIVENSRWSRIIYRHIDLSNPTNTPLNNLFTMIFRLLQNNEIKAYEYLDGRELFTNEYLINFTQFIERFGIYHEVENGNIVVNDADIPTHEVQGYYLKELYYFDTSTSSLRVLPISICPIISRNDNYEGTIRYPLFWIPYSEIEQKTRKTPVMLSGINNSMRGTVDDFFRTRLYDGEIYKTGNPGNLSISQYTNTPEEIKAEQDRIEQELIDFENQLRQSHTATNTKNSKTTSNQNRRINVRTKDLNSGGATQSMRTRRY